MYTHNNVCVRITCQKMQTWITSHIRLSFYQTIDESSIKLGNYLEKYFFNMCTVCLCLIFNMQEAQWNTYQPGWEERWQNMTDWFLGWHVTLAVRHAHSHTQIGHKLGVSEGKRLPFCLCWPQCDPTVSVSQMSLICYREVNPNEFHSLSLAYQRTMYLHTHVALV